MTIELEKRSPATQGGSESNIRPSLSLTTDPIPLLTRQIAIPASVGFFFNTMFNLVDTYCAGLLSTDALAGLSLSFPVFFVLMAMGSGLSQGTTALMANAIGKGDRETACRLFAQALLFAVALGAVLTIAGWCGSPALFRLLGAEGDYLRTALAYMNALLAGSIFFILQMTLNSALSAEGNTRLYRNFLIYGCIANCALNPVLMWGWFGLPRMGVAGIALATVLVQICGCALLWRGVRSHELFREWPAGSFKPQPAVLLRLAGQAVPAALNMLTIALGIFVISWFVKHFGKEAVAASGIATRIEQFVLMPAIGLNTAVLSLVGQNNGAGLTHRVRETWLTNIKYGVGLAVAGGILLFSLRAFALRQFTTDELVASRAFDYLGVAAVTLPAYPILFTTVFLLQGLKRPTYGLWMGLYRQFLAPMLVFNTLAFTLGWGLRGVWWGIGIVNWSAALFALWWGWRAVRPHRSAIDAELQNAGAD
jgi:putative MATE family efflux protein